MSSSAHGLPGPGRHDARRSRPPGAPRRPRPRPGGSPRRRRTRGRRRPGPAAAAAVTQRSGQPAARLHRRAADRGRRRRPPGAAARRRAGRAPPGPAAAGGRAASAPCAHCGGRVPPASARQTRTVDDDLRALRDACTRALTGHGIQRADDLLATIPPGTAVDRYGEGGVVAELEAEVAGILGPAGRGLPAERDDGPAGGAARARGPAGAAHRRLPPRVPPRPARGPGAGAAARAGRPARRRPPPPPRGWPTSPPWPNRRPRW